MNAAFQPASTGLDHALVACDLTVYGSNQGHHCVVKAGRSRSKRLVRFNSFAPK